MPGRPTSSGSYRYGFNGKENDNEVKGEGNQQDYGMRIYDPRIGKFLSVDPLTKSYPWLTPYQFASNTPIAAIDLDGLEGLVATGMPMGSSGDGHGMIVSPEMARKINHEHPEVAKGILLVGAITSDVLLTKGWMTRTLLASQVLGAVEHNRATTPEGRAAQDQRRNEALADAFITWGTGKMLGVGMYTSAEVVRLATNRFSFAKNFYKAAGYSEKDAVDGVRGIELTDKVFETTLKKGTVVEQWLKVDKATGELRPGNYYTLPGADPSKLGISLEGRVKVQSVLNEDTKFLQSTTADIVDTWSTPGKPVATKGGEVQLFQTKVNATRIKQ